MRLASLDLNLLLVLDAVLGERSVVRAAKRLHVTPSAVSNGLARLRAVLGDPLVIKSGRGIVPTPRALELAPPLTRALHELDVAVHGARFDPLTSEQQFTLAMADAAQLVRLPKIAARMAHELPRARLRVVGIDALAASGGLAGTFVDAAIGVAEKMPGNHSVPLYDERTVIVARADHPTLGASASRSALAGVAHVDVQLTVGVGNEALTRAFTQAGIARAVAVIVPTFAAAAAVVAASDYVAALPASVVKVLGKRLGLRVIRTPLLPIAQPIHLVWHARTDADPAHAALRQVVLRSLGSQR